MRMSSRRTFRENVRTRFLARALFESIQEKDLRSIKYLLFVKKTDPNYLLEDLDVAPLHLAASIEDEHFSVDVVRTCIECGGDPNVRNSDGITPVHVAAMWKRQEVLDLLLELGGDPSLVDDDGFSALYYMNNSDTSLHSIALKNQSAAPTDYGVDKEKSMTETNHVGAPVCRQRYSGLEYSSSSSSHQPEDGRDTLNDAFIEDHEERFHSFSSQQNSLLLSDVPSDLCCSEIKIPHIDSNIHKFQSPFIDSLYESVEKVSMYLSSHNHPQTAAEVQFAHISGTKEPFEARFITTIPRFSSDKSSFGIVDSTHPESSCGSLSSCPTEKLRHLLQEQKIPCGPLVKSTKRVYLYQLRKASNGLNDKSPNLQVQPLDYNDVVLSTLSGKIKECVDKWSPLESLMVEQLEKHSKEELKLDSCKQYFTYLLLDPVISKDIEKSTTQESLNRSWPYFLNSVFYIGKGKNARPLDHLVDAVKNTKASVSDKVRRIKTIWEKGFGIVCIHIFHNVSEAEALTREACMISAMSIGRLTNVQNGKSYCGIQKWSLKKRRQIGVVLLYRAMLLLIAEGERQIFPVDLKK